MTGDNTKNNDNNIGQNNSELSDDSDDGVISTNDSIVMGGMSILRRVLIARGKLRVEMIRLKMGRNKEIMTKSKMMWYCRIRISPSMFRE